MVHYPGKALDLTRNIFYESILDSGGVILFVKYDFFCQIATRGPKKTREGVLSVYNKKKVREVDEEVVTGTWPQGKVG